jgi:hypothetical protein
MGELHSRLRRGRVQIAVLFPPPPDCWRYYFEGGNTRDRLGAGRLNGPCTIPVQAAPLSPAATSIELVRQGCGWDGTAPTGVTARAIGTGATGSRTSDFPRQVAQTDRRHLGIRSGIAGQICVDGTNKSLRENIVELPCPVN